VIGLAGKVFARRDCLRALGVGTAYVCPDRLRASMSRRRRIRRRQLARQTVLELAKTGIFVPFLLVVVLQLLLKWSSGVHLQFLVPGFP
jgi:hypothetical protein